MWYRVGKLIVETGASARGKDQWSGSWTLLEETESGLVPVGGGWDNAVFELPMEAADVGGARGVDEARRAQGDMSLEAKNYRGPYAVNAPTLRLSH